MVAGSGTGADVKLSTAKMLLFPVELAPRSGKLQMLLSLIPEKPESSAALLKRENPTYSYVLNTSSKVAGEPPVALVPKGQRKKLSDIISKLKVCHSSVKSLRVGLTASLETYHVPTPYPTVLVFAMTHLIVGMLPAIVLKFEPVRLKSEINS